MSGLTELPGWVWTLLDALDRYEEEHAPLYQMGDDVEFERTKCIGSFLDERKAWPPQEVRDAAEFRRHVLDSAGDA